MVAKKIDQIEAEELKKLYNQYLDKIKKIMKNNSFKVEDVFGDIISEDSFSPEQKTKFNIPLAKILRIIFLR